MTGGSGVMAPGMADGSQNGNRVSVTLAGRRAGGRVAAQRAGDQGRDGRRHVGLDRLHRDGSACWRLSMTSSGDDPACGGRVVSR